jgi:hypothetical protein
MAGTENIATRAGIGVGGVLGSLIFVIGYLLFVDRQWILNVSGVRAQDNCEGETLGGDAEGSRKKMFAGSWHDCDATHKRCFSKRL